MARGKIYGTKTPLTRAGFEPATYRMLPCTPPTAPTVPEACSHLGGIYQLAMFTLGLLGLPTWLNWFTHGLLNTKKRFGHGFHIIPKGLYQVCNNQTMQTGINQVQMFCKCLHLVSIWFTYPLTRGTRQEINRQRVLQIIFTQKLAGAPKVPSAGQNARSSRNEQPHAHKALSARW